MKKLVVTGSFDDLASRHVRFLEEASKLGDVNVLLWSDEAVCSLEGRPPKYPERERLYLLQAIRYVRQATLVAGQVDPDAIPQINGIRPEAWVWDEASDSIRRQAYCLSHGLDYRVLKKEDLEGFPVMPSNPHSRQTSRRRVMVTGCYDWFHSGHVRFFEEASQLGDLYVVVGHDENIRLLKGEGHPLFLQDERRYMVQSIRHVTQALVSTGHGWMDAEPEIALLNPGLYVVNEDGDVPEKRAFCEARGIEYVVLRRAPKEGLPRRQSTDLRGF